MNETNDSEIRVQTQNFNEPCWITKIGSFGYGSEPIILYIKNA